MSDTAKALRAKLKAAGYNARLVSVRHHQYSMGSTIHCTIRDPDVKKAAIEDIALEFQRVDRCQISGEILTGCNRFVDVEFSDQARDILLNRALPSVNIALERLEAHKETDTTLEPCLGGHIGWDRCSARYTVRDAKDSHMYAFNADGVAAHLMGI